MAKKPLEIDMIAGSQLRDTQGEMLSVEGADITDLQLGRGRFNDNHGKGFFNSIGRVTEAKKIFKEEDCENDRHRYYWNKVKAPYIYVKGFLYDDEDHMNAKAAAAILRNVHKTDCPLKLKASVEGGVIARGITDETLLARTKIHSVAITFTPANNATLVEPVSLVKNAAEPDDDKLIKSVMHLAQDRVPSFRHIYRNSSARKVHDNLCKIQELVKTIRGEHVELKIPSPDEILVSAIEAKIESNVAKIYEAVKLAKGEEMNKGIKDALAGAAAAGLIASSPGKASAEMNPTVPQQQQVTHESVIAPLKNKHPHLWALAHVESSGGKDTAHDRIISNESMHTGHTAGGPWGIMPHTAQYITSISSGLRKKYPKLAEMTKDKESVQKNHEKITKFFNENPKGALDFANTLYNRLNRVHKGDKDKIAHSWYHGIKGTKRAIDKGKDISKHDYVTKFNNLLTHGDKRGKVEKALTAGYGGAGAPTNLVSGGVLQPESQEAKLKNISLGSQTNKSDGFKYTTCDNCGKEQIYSKHQVKCRECGKPWGLSKLMDLLKWD